MLSEMARFHLFYSAIPLLDIHLKKIKTLILKDTCIPMFTASLHIIAKMQKQLKCWPMDEWIKNMWCIYMCVYIYTHSAIRKDKIFRIIFRSNKISGYVIMLYVLLCFHLLPYF